MALNFKGLLESKDSIISDIIREFPEATLITASNAAVNARDTVYTVPTGKKLLLMSLNLSGSFNSSMTGESARAFLAGGIVLRLWGGVNAYEDSILLDTPEILKLNAGTVIDSESTDPGIVADVAITGYLMPEGN